MKIKMAKFLPMIISLLDNYVTVGVSSDVHVLATEVPLLLPIISPIVS
jgi:hypothetical protein